VVYQGILVTITQRYLKILEGLMKALTVLAFMATLGVSGVAQAAPQAAAPLQRQQECRAGILVDALTGRPVLGPDRQTVPCGAPPEAGLGLDPVYALSGLVGLGAGIGIGAAIWSGHRQQTQFIPVVTPVPVSP
jgi:hypothetical protein